MGTNKKIPSVIKSLTVDRATFSNERIGGLTYINFFYGNNGVGKSSIAKAIEANEGVDWFEGNNPNDFELLVYNQEFINKNFANYSNLKGIYIVNEKNTQIYEEIEAKKQALKTLEEKHRLIKASLAEKTTICNQMTQKYHETLFQKVKDIRAEFALALDGKKRKDGFITALFKAKAKSRNLEELRQMLVAFDDAATPYEELKTVKFPINSQDDPGRSLLDVPIVSSSDTGFARFMKTIGSIDWVKQGYAHYQKANPVKCPYCQQSLPPTFEEDIKNAFDSRYIQDLNDLEDYKNDYVEDMNSADEILKNNLKNAMPLSELSIYKEKFDLWDKTVKLNWNRLIDKGISPSKVIVLEDTDSIISSINAIIADINEKTRAHNEAVSKRKDTQTKLKKYIMEYFAYVLSDEMNDFNAQFAKASKEEATAKADEEKLRSQISELNKNISDLNSKIVNIEATIDSINKILYEAGFQGFYLRANPNISGTYEVVRENKEQEGAAENLSEGERNFIAFLYFYHLVRGSVNSENTKDKIVVIDDPVSSMDSNSLFIVGAIIREMINVCRNNTQYDNLAVPGDYIRQMFILTHNVYFHREITYGQVKHFDSVSFYIIRKHKNISSVKLCVQKNPYIPSEDENANPVRNSYAALWDELKEIQSTIPAKNVMRQILEYYFLQLCGYDGNYIRSHVLEKNKSKFIDMAEGQKPDMTNYELASCLLSYINNPNGISDGLNYIEETDDVDKYKNIFRLIFEALGQEQHYNMMMGINA